MDLKESRAVIAPSSRASKTWQPFAVCLALFLFIYLAATPIYNKAKLILLPLPDKHDDSWIHASKKNVWADLSSDEAKEVTKFVLSSSVLNLTETSQASR